MYQFFFPKDYYLGELRLFLWVCSSREFSPAGCCWGRTAPAGPVDVPAPFFSMNEWNDPPTFRRRHFPYTKIRFEARRDSIYTKICFAGRRDSIYTKIRFDARRDSTYTKMRVAARWDCIYTEMRFEPRRDCIYTEMRAAGSGVVEASVCKKFSPLRGPGR